MPSLKGDAGTCSAAFVLQAFLLCVISLSPYKDKTKTGEDSSDLLFLSCLFCIFPENPARGK